MITNSTSQFIFAAMKRTDYLPFAVRNAREEFPLPQMVAQQQERLRDGAEPNVPTTITTVCDGWTSPRHPRVILTPGDMMQPVSHGMCRECQRRMEEQ